MTIEEKAVVLLRETEASLRQLAAQAAEAGDYAVIIKVAAWAKAVSDLVKSPTPDTRPKPRNPTGRVKTRRHTSTRSVKRKEYPRFFRHGEQLIRVAWSKREKKEYQHKAPYGVLKALTAAVVEAGKEGRVFSTDQVLPIHDQNDGSEIPNYQAYVCIAWLKQTRLIDQHGRQGYSIPRLEEFQNAVGSIWQTLPKQ